MSRLLASHTDSRDNNFNLIRFVAAALVLLDHSWALTGGEHVLLIGHRSLGHIAVDMFFFTSGLLVTRSLVTRGNLVAFTWARVVRIYPALIAAVLFCVCIGLAFTTVDTADFVFSRDLAGFVVFNSTLAFGKLQQYLPGLFRDNPFPGVVNGSLWTLPWEVRMYAALAGVGLLSLLAPVAKRSAFVHVSVGLAAATTLFATIATTHADGIADNLAHGLRLGALFFLGGTFYSCRRFIRLSYWGCGACVLTIAALRDAPFPLTIAYTVLLGYIIVCLAYLPAGKIRAFNRCGDYSYGLYIYAFPVQQSLAHWKPDITPVEMFWAAGAITLALAVLSWHGLEQRMLRTKDAYRRFVPEFLVRRLSTDSSDRSR